MSAVSSSSRAEPVTRSAIGAVDELVRRLVEAGVERASRGLVDEIAEVARTAHQGRLATIERDLVALSTQVQRWLDRDPQFRLGGWVDAISRLWWRAAAARRVLDDPDATEAARAAVLGVLRRTYTPVAGTVTVSALGAAGWVSDSGYAGITVHLWDEAGQRTLTATQARPIGLVDDPRRLLFQPVSEVSLLTVHELAHGAWELDDVRLSPDGRVSLHSGLVAVPRAPAGAAAYRACAVDGAEALLDRLAESELDPAGFGGGTLAWIELSAVRDVVVDETAALASAWLVDRRGGTLHVVVPIRPERDLLIDNLARLCVGPAPVGVFGRASLAGGELRFEPYTAVFDSPVKLALRRSGLVQEVHLGLEPLGGEPQVARGRVPRPEAPREDPLSRTLAATGRALEPLFASGLGGVTPDAAAAVRGAADRWAEVEVRHAAARLAELADTLDAVRAGDRAAIGAAHDHAQWAAAWVRLGRVGVAADLARQQLGGVRVAPAPRRPGEDLALVPIGAERSGRRLTIHALHARSGAPAVVIDELPGLDDDAFGRPWPSALFQRDLSLAELFAHQIVLRNHPVQRGRRGIVVQPAFDAAAAHGARLGPCPIPRTPDAVPGVAFRTWATGERGPEGWVLRVGARGTPVPVEDVGLRLDFEKRSAVDALTFEVVGRLMRDEIVVWQVDGRLPSFDPRATRWSVAAVLRRAGRDSAMGAWLGAALGGPVPALPGPDPLGDAVRGLVAQGHEADGKALVAAHVARLGRSLGEGGVLPSGPELWRLARLASPVDVARAPIRTLPVPVGRLWLAAASGLAAWLRGAATEAEAVDAMVLVVGAGLADVLFEGDSL